MAAIGFKTAKCKDCYKCVRICPVKAIRIKDEHALYVADECVLCGRCLEACPQDAVVYVSDLNKAKKYIREGNVTVASLDPAYLGIFGDIIAPSNYTVTIFPSLFMVAFVISSA